ncbi:MAG: divalent-cation tolerance protein CutA [Candidatus Omnitrophota bacterium]|jgi:periplasmic divalent cation tolerance protein|nr:divalent-cation tolerance protein CutA [Candidatus Omnitrophota bacterium]MDD5538800.1 divalent-cation tolerance protein CutA [Candidatus Omnitrophota bacterium]
MKYCVVFMTAPQGPEARSLADMLLKKRLCACVNIVKGMASFFWWRGKIDAAAESLLIAKTEQRLVKKIIREVGKVHSYSVCEIIAMPIVAANAPYLEWISASLKRSKTT